MGSQRYLIEDLTAIGVPNDENLMKIVHAIEELRSIGDDVADALWPWFDGRKSFVDAYDGVCQVLARSRTMIDIVSDSLPNEPGWRTSVRT